MRTWITETYSDDAKFVQAKGSRREPNFGEVEIRVKATSLNPVDNKLLRHATPWNPKLPGILHCDVSGIVTAIGEGVKNFKVGDDVYGCAGGIGQLSGALSDYMVVDEKLIAVMPNNLNYLEAATLPLVTITAWEALKIRAQMKVDSHILIHGGAGGVGHIAIQLAKAWGARVATTVSNTAKGDIATKLGADDVILYPQESVESYVKRLTDNVGFDIVFDTVGGSNLDKSLIAAKASGQVAGIIGSNTHDLSPMHAKGLSLHLVMMLLPMFNGLNREVHGSILKDAAKLIEESKLRPLIDKNTFTFDQVNEAHAYYEAGHAIGKISLVNT